MKSGLVGYHANITPMYNYFKYQVLCSNNLGTEVGLNFQGQRNINVQCPVETIFPECTVGEAPYCSNILIIKKIKKYTQQKL
jgi:hypothetical protein